MNYDILNQNHACQHQKADDMAAILPFWNRDDLFFYNISIIVRWISN